MRELDVVDIALVVGVTDVVLGRREVREVRRGVKSARMIARRAMADAIVFVVYVGSCWLCCSVISGVIWKGDGVGIAGVRALYTRDVCVD